MENLMNQITGLKESLKQLRVTERLHIKSATMLEQIEKARSAQDNLTEELETVKEKKAKLKEERAGMLKESCYPLADAITALLPRGRAVVTLNGQLFIGWEHEGRVSPYQGLSGGERTFFDGALSNALLRGKGEKILIVEAAEADAKNLSGMLESIARSNPETQVLVNSWVEPEKVPEGWLKVVLK